MLEDRVQVAGSPGAEETAAQVDKLLASPPFQHSDPTRRLLAFLAQRFVTHPGQPVKEIELAMSVYDLSPDKFDPQLDSAVRVKVGRLRAKILDYYANYGQNDEIVLEIPKGAYCLLSHYRQVAEAQTDPEPNIVAPTELKDIDVGGRSGQTLQQQGKRRYWWATFLLLGAVLGSVGTLISLRATHHINPVPDHLEQFWSGLSANGQPLVGVFSNPRLAGVLAHGGLHYFRDVTDPSTPVNLGYAGAGDVQSVHALTQLFDQLHRDLRIESGALLSWDSAKDSNLIFIGRPEQNPALDELPRLREFYFKYNLGIVNAHPQAGESSSYQYSQPDSYDYAVIAFIPGIHAPENTLILAGDTTWGSLAAVEFMTRDRSVGELLDRLNVKPGQKAPYFEALLKVRINNNIPVWSTLLAVRPHPTEYSSWEPPLPDER
jgi:hypothetical protein